MSRIGYSPIVVPSGVQVTVADNNVTITGPKGNLQFPLRPEIDVTVENDTVLVKRKNDDRFVRSVHGLTRSIINNMVIGVTKGWTKQLEMIGVGYRAQGGGDTLTLNVGYSHPVSIKAPQGVTFAVADNTKITVSGIDRGVVGQIAANIRAVKVPEVYKGKGIRYVGEMVKRKAGKVGKAGAK